MIRVVTEPEFAEALAAKLRELGPALAQIGSVTGPGRSGAVAAVYASHVLGVPFIPDGHTPPAALGRPLIIDTARQSGATLRKIARRCAGADPVVVAVFEEPPRVTFWYEAAKPQRYRHERRAA